MWRLATGCGVRLPSWNRFALAIHDGARGSSGTVMIAAGLAEAGVGAVRQRCHDWAGHLRSVDELVHRYPLVAFTYRSHRHEYDPEPALRHAAEATVAALVAARWTSGLRGEYAAVVVHRSRILLDGLQQWTRGDIDNHEW
jgi:hypothetical protein